MNHGASDDLYALGSTFYELLTSRTPFYSGDITYQVLNEMPKPLTDRVQELGLKSKCPMRCAMIMACLAKDPAHRPPSAVAVEEWISSGGTEAAGYGSAHTAFDTRDTGQVPSDFRLSPLRCRHRHHHPRFINGLLLVGSESKRAIILGIKVFMAVAALFALWLVVGLKVPLGRRLFPAL